MVIGIASGLFMSGLLMGGISGSVLIMVIFAGAGLLVAGIAEAIRISRDKTAASCKLRQYPPYGY